MKNKKLFLATTILLFGIIFQSNGQTTWNLAGNAVSTPAVEFLGTTNNSSLLFKTGNIFSGFIEPNPTEGNTAFGFSSLKTYSINPAAYISGKWNSAFGNSTLTANTSGQENSAFGYWALSANISGAGNTAFGRSTLLNNTTGSLNTAFGLYACQRTTTGGSNIGVGFQALQNNTMGGSNIAIGVNSLISSVSLSGNLAIGSSALSGLASSGTDNIAVGLNAGGNFASGGSNCFFGANSGGGSLSTSTGSNNVCFGTSTGRSITSGSSNSFFGINCGLNITTGGGNTFLGNVQVPTTSATSTMAGINTNSTIILADGAAIQRFYIDSNGFAGIGLANNVIPKNTLEIKALTGSPTQAGFAASGLRLASLPNTNFNTVAPTTTRRVLTTNANGDAILVDDIGGGITQNCSTANFVPVNSTTAGVLGCSQIFDNGTSVGIGLTSPTTNNWTYSSLTTVGVIPTPTTGTVKFDVNGVIRSAAYLATSDRKFKKDIKPIENALKTIEAIDGKTYLWNREANKEMNFDGGGHSGFIAQELEKVLPHLVATGQNGDKAVNYMELMPYLVEAIKEQQSQIKEQQNQIVELNNKIQDLVTKGILDENKITDGRTYFSSNYPNPFDTVTKIDYFIDKNVGDSKIVVFDVNGATISSYNLKERGIQSTLSISKDNLKTGVYFYTLITDGSVIGTKKMIVK